MPFNVGVAATNKEGITKGWGFGPWRVMDGIWDTTQGDGRDCEGPRRDCVSGFTSKKRCGKESQSFSHCGLFDHPDLQSLNDCRFFFFCFTVIILNFWGHVIHR